MRPQRSPAEIRAAVNAHLTGRESQATASQVEESYGNRGQLEGDDYDWHLHMRCRTPGVDPRLFDPPKPDESMVARNRREKLAIQACRLCPVRMACLLETVTEEMKPLALYELRDRTGVRGAMTDAQRERFRKKPR